MGRKQISTTVRVRAVGWGKKAAARLHDDWLGRVWTVDPEGVLLVSEAGEMVSLVPHEVGNGPFHVVLAPDGAEALHGLKRGTWVWRVGEELWVGDSLTVLLPDAEPWDARLDWHALRQENMTALARRLHWLADALLARAPEGSFAGLLPELLAGEELTDRPDLERHGRLLRWRAARVLRHLMPAMEMGDMVTVETLGNRAAGLGPGAPPAGDHFLIGLIAGTRLWPHVVEASGLKVEPVLRRMALGAAERTSLLGWGLIHEALAGAFSEPWHQLARLLQDDSNHPDEQHARLVELVKAWLERPDVLGGSGLAGFVLPFLWHQRVMS